jgi:hypothetical protein
MPGYDQLHGAAQHIEFGRKATKKELLQLRVATVALECHSKRGLASQGYLIHRERAISPL